MTKLVNESGTVVESYTYDEFGNTYMSDTNPFGYCGEYYDTETGMVYLRARYYDPEIGRFISEDPARDDLNWYVYCGSNPINFLDPLGLTLRPLTEIAEERGLSVNWNGKSGADWAVTVDGHHITLNYQHTDGDWYLNLDGFEQSGKDLFLNANDNKVYIDDSLFNCKINDGSGVTDEGWMISATLVGGAVALKAGIATAISVGVKNVAPTIPILSNIDPNKINHIFNKTEHKLGPLLQKFDGNTTSAYIAVQNAAQKVVNSQNFSGVFDSVKNPITVNVSGIIINVGGIVVDGILRIGTFYAK